MERSEVVWLEKFTINFAPCEVCTHTRTHLPVPVSHCVAALNKNREILLWFFFSQLSDLKVSMQDFLSFFFLWFVPDYNLSKQRGPSSANNLFFSFLFLVETLGNDERKHSL